MQKVRRHPCGLRPLVGMRFQVLFHSPPGVLFTFPSRYWYTIGLWRVFSLGRWSCQIHTRFLVSRATRETYGRLSDFDYGAITRYGPPFQNGSSILSFVTPWPIAVGLYDPATPVTQRLHPWHATGLGCSPFARRYLGNHCCFLFLEVLRCFSSLRSRNATEHDFRRVLPFGNRRVQGCLHLTDAYRSLPRPSSPSRA